MESICSLSQGCALSRVNPSRTVPSANPSPEDLHGIPRHHSLSTAASPCLPGCCREPSRAVYHTALRSLRFIRTEKNE